MRYTDMTLVFTVPTLPVRLTVNVYSCTEDMTCNQIVEEAHKHLRAIGVDLEEVQLIQTINHLEEKQP